MQLPFTHEAFLRVFAAYNTGIWPVQWFLNLIAVLATLTLFRRSRRNSMVAGYSLAALWLWTGIVYHLLYFTAINKAAYIFGAACIAEGLILLYATRTKKPEFQFAADPAGIAGVVMIVYALVLYPLLGYLLGRSYPAAPTFGAPCPTTIFTIGMLLNSVHVPRWKHLLIPWLWSVIGFSAAVNLSITEDFGLVITGVASFLLMQFPGAMAKHQPLQHAK